MAGKTNLVVGDVHSTPDEIDDCQNLLDFVLEQAVHQKADTVTFMGDQFNTHDVLNVRCIELWQRNIGKLLGAVEKVIMLVGNHDQVTPTLGYPHAMIPFKGRAGVHIVDAPTLIDGIGYMPYYYSQDAFREGFNVLARQTKTIFCHQTFQGAVYENSFYAPDGIDLSTLNIDDLQIVSGHIHAPQSFGPVTYVGAPRWRSRSDADEDRFIYTYRNIGDGHIMGINKASTRVACRVFYSFADRPERPLTKKDFNDIFLGDKVFVDIYGPDKTHVSARDAEIRKLTPAKVITRLFPEQKKRANKLSEKEGISAAFEKFFESFVPPHGTDKNTLKSMLAERGLL